MDEERRNDVLIKELIKTTEGLAEKVNSLDEAIRGNSGVGLRTEVVQLMTWQYQHIKHHDSLSARFATFAIALALALISGGFGLALALLR